MQVFRIIFYWLKVGVAYLQTPKYSIKRGYIHRKKALVFDDSSLTNEFQQEVYQRAEEIYQEKKLKGILDIGCGSGYKLIRFFENEPTAGVELDSALLKEKYPDKLWFDYENKEWKTFAAGMLICADVIEHVYEPDSFLEELSSLTQVKYFIFSTPDRALDKSPWVYGPPNNECHFREWTFSEFEKFVSRYFQIIEHRISNKEQRTQVIICCHYPLGS
ncbi:MAG: hypothetical protein J5I91_04810 [Bacteroidetes bacterium]|nr:hypothetical protein [Bacteroidota bacterium]